jgi:hypothetical protein
MEDGDKMVNEWMQILVMASCGALFAIGGTGWKPARRYGIPVLLLVIALISGVLWWKSVLMALSLVIALSLGYGDKTAYWLKAIVFATYGLSFLWIGWSLWVVLTPVLCFSLFCLSNWKITSKDFFWKACEFIYGTLIGITFISVVNHG